MSRFRQVAPYLLIGPIGGPLVAGAVINFRAGRPLLGSLFAVALVAYSIALPTLVARLSLPLR